MDFSALARHFLHKCKICTCGLIHSPVICFPVIHTRVIGVAVARGGRLIIDGNIVMIGLERGKIEISDLQVDHVRRP